MGQISHDFRTPLNSVSLLLNSAVQSQEKNTEVMKNKYIQPAINNCNFLMSLIKDVLTYAKEDLQNQAKHTISIKPTNIRKILSGVCIGFFKRAEICGIEFKHFINDKIPDSFNTGDPPRRAP